MDLSDGVAVVGCGRMGCAMAGELARRGCKVVMYDNTDFTRSRAKQVLQATLSEHVSNGLLLAHEMHEILARVGVAETLEAAVAHAVVVFEAVIDDLELKRDLFQQMGAASASASASAAVLTTNSINLDVLEISRGTTLTVWGCRFLHPVWFIDDVEVATGGRSTDAISPTLASLGFKVSYYKGERRRLSEVALERYYSEARAAAASRRDAAPAVVACTAVTQSKTAGDQGGAEPCAVCLDAPRSALLVPCGHASTCMSCTRQLSPPLCVTCRQPIEKVLPWSPS